MSDWDGGSDSPYGYWEGDTWIRTDAPTSTPTSSAPAYVAPPPVPAAPLPSAPVDMSQVAYTAAPNYEGTPTEYYNANNDLIGYLGRDNTPLSTSGINFVDNSGQATSANKLANIQLTDPSGKPLYLDLNSLDSSGNPTYTTQNTGHPATWAPLASQMKLNEPQNQSLFADPLFRNFLLSAAAMGGAAALAPAAGGAGTAADFGSVGDFLAADAAASQAGASQFALADALGMPLDEAVTAGLIGADGTLTAAGAEIMAGIDAAGQTGMAVAGGAGAAGLPSWLSSALSAISPSSLFSAAKTGVGALGSLFGGTGIAGNRPTTGSGFNLNLSGTGTGNGSYSTLQSNAPPGGTASSFGGSQIATPTPWAYGGTAAQAYPVLPQTPITALPDLEFAEGGEVGEGGGEHNPEFYSEGGLRHTYAKGGGDGTSDSVPAMLATGEFVIPADVVSGLGNGDNDAGAEVLDKFLVTVRKHKRSTNPEELPPDSKGPLAYLEEARQ